MNDFNKEKSLLKTSDGKEPAPCSAYDNGYCTELKRDCDGCYENSMKFWNEFMQ